MIMFEKIFKNNKNNSYVFRSRILTVFAVLVLILLIVVFVLGHYFYAPACLWIYYRQNFSGDNYHIEKWIKGTTKEERDWYAEIDHHGKTPTGSVTMVVSDTEYPDRVFWIRYWDGQCKNDYAYMKFDTQYEQLLHDMGDTLFGEYRYSFWKQETSCGEHFWYLRDDSEKILTMDDYFASFHRGLRYIVCDPNGEIDREQMVLLLEEAVYQSGYEIPFLVITFMEEEGRNGYDGSLPDLVNQRHREGRQSEEWEVNLENGVYGEIEITYY